MSAFDKKRIKMKVKCRKNVKRAYKGRGDIFLGRLNKYEANDVAIFLAY